MTDVIFNGSSARQPVAQASVELVFDNAEKKLGGQYASYNELSIKREINRDSISTYYLNGVRCRRRDIVSVFLGTGIGPRSYAIIEQGMISRLIEAKPEELRVFIEEAAGISKYRERRRETENRIKHARENIERLTDIRGELEKQLNHLRGQAEAAKRYKTLKEEERRLQSELLALQWRDLREEMTGLERTAGERENAVEAAMAKFRATEADIEKRRGELVEANRHFNDVQSDYYKVGGDISRYEQKLQHIRETIGGIEREIEQQNRNHADTLEQQKQDKVTYRELRQELEKLEMLLRDSRIKNEKADVSLHRAEETMQGWQAEWDKLNNTLAEFDQQIEVDKTHLEHLEFDLEGLLGKRERLQKKIAEFESSDLESRVAMLTHRLDGEEKKHAALANDCTRAQYTVVNCRQKLKGLSADMDEAKQAFQSAKGRLVSLQTLQQSFMLDNRELKVWLDENALDEKPRLVQVLKINPKWTHALETVIQSQLHHLCVDNPCHYLDVLDKAPGKFGLVSKANQPVLTDIKNYPRLVDEITTDIRVPFLLETVYLAESLVEATAILSDLSSDESVVTRQGIWLNRNWIIVNNTDDGDSILSHEHEISVLTADIKKYNGQIREYEDASKLAEEDLEQSETSLHRHQAEVNKQLRTISDIRADMGATQAELQQSSIRHQQQLEELESNWEQEEEDRHEIKLVRERLDRMEKERLGLEQQREELSRGKEKHRESLNSSRLNWKSAHESSHEISLTLESYNSRLAICEQAIKRSDVQLSELQTRRSVLEKNLAENRAPIEKMEKEQQTFLQDKVAVEQKLTEAKTRVQNIETVIRDLEQYRHKLEQSLEGLRVGLEKSRLEVNGCQVKLKSLEEQSSAFDRNPEEMLAALDAVAGQEGWADKVESVARKIQRLGPINLAAIDEYEQGVTRKLYLDNQYNDLLGALTTLEDAIRKIDRETRTRFKTTFDALNDGIKGLFPKLFGGGHASLELTDSDLLQTGVAVMARPPGKKNSNIHLLSGGEKALTAVALIFSIFKLNPAPFCLLDEVDAPLDDENVERFGELLTLMSAETQFIFVTHNKITMEIAQQLLGVTMHEAGVSRLVSVDVDKVVGMAATA